MLGDGKIDGLGLIIDDILRWRHRGVRNGIGINGERRDDVGCEEVES